MTVYIWWMKVTLLVLSERMKVVKKPDSFVSNRSESPDLETLGPCQISHRIFVKIEDNTSLEVSWRIWADVCILVRSRILL